MGAKLIVLLTVTLIHCGASDYIRSLELYVGGISRYCRFCMSFASLAMGLLYVILH